jgi:nucleoside-diphosphate-sugar epimerase
MKFRFINVSQSGTDTSTGSTLIMAPLKVLVTGASGFVATWVVKESISRGYSVRGAVRNPAKGDYLKSLFGNKFDYVIVEDMEKVV